MIEWTEDNRSNYDSAITDVIDGFNNLNTSDQMLDFLLSRPPNWICDRWELIPLHKFGEVLKTIRESMEVPGV